MKVFFMKSFLLFLILFVGTTAKASWTDDEIIEVYKKTVYRDPNTRLSQPISHPLIQPSTSTLTKSPFLEIQESTNLAEPNNMKNFVNSNATTLEEDITKTQSLCKSEKPLDEFIQDLTFQHSDSLQKIDSLKQEIQRINDLLGGTPAELRVKINDDPSILTINNAIESAQKIFNSNKPLVESAQALINEHDKCLQETRNAISLLHDGALDLRTAISDIISLVGNFDGKDLYTKIETARSTVYHSNGSLKEALQTIRAMIRPSSNQEKVFINDIFNLSLTLALKLKTLQGRNDVSVPNNIPNFITAEEAVDYVIKEIN